MYARRFEILEKEKWLPVRLNVICKYRLWSGNQRAVSIVKCYIYFYFSHSHQLSSDSRDRIVVSTSRCGRDNPGSNPGHGKCCDRRCHGTVELCFFFLLFSFLFYTQIKCNSWNFWTQNQNLTYLIHAYAICSNAVRMIIFSKKYCKASEKSVKCEECEKRFHTSCINLGEKELMELELGNGSWYCTSYKADCGLCSGAVLYVTK